MIVESTPFEVCTQTIRFSSIVLELCRKPKMDYFSIENMENAAERIIFTESWLSMEDSHSSSDTEVEGE